MNAKNRKYFNTAGKVCTLLASALLVAACGSGGGGGDDDVQEVADKGRGPQFSVEVSAYCGNPGDVVLDTDGYTILHTFDEDNVVVFLSNESGDNGLVKDYVETLEIQCYEKTAQGKDGYTDLGDTIELTGEGFGKLERKCAAESGTEIKATVTVIDADLRKSVSDTCEEIVLY